MRLVYPHLISRSRSFRECRMPPVSTNIFSTRTLKLNGREYQYYPLAQLEDTYAIDLDQLPYSIRILLESAIRNFNGESITQQNVESLSGWTSTPGDHGSTSFIPARILLQDLTGVPLVVDLASLRSAAVRAGKKPFPNQSIAPGGSGDRPFHPGGFCRVKSGTG
jgi:aconitate hydratase